MPPLHRRSSRSKLLMQTRARRANVMSALPSCVDGSELARAFFTFAALVGAPMCSAF
jgi:hypothetical protein